MTIKRNGGYEVGYAACPCFWGVEPGSYVRKLVKLISRVTDLRALDAGCGEGKNAAFLAELGCDVTAVDISELAIVNAKKLHSLSKVRWLTEDLMVSSFPLDSFDIVIAYGVFHCLSSPREIEDLHFALAGMTKKGGYHVICSFNDRDQDLSAHPGFEPCLMPHEFYLRLYQNWTIESESDQTLFESHPHNLIPHHHSLSRLLARKA
jgi:tellurite methyltransferase